MSTVSGGGGNVASAFYSTVGGGNGNLAQGRTSFAAGYRAKALHNGAFVWGDTTNSDVTSSVSNQFTARTSGGARCFSNAAMTTGVTMAPGGGSWASISDRNLKEHFEAVDAEDILARVATLATYCLVRRKAKSPGR